mmetsp:Transcript_21646/g.30319  ORF Transcript_21646/g.30319 Transcript_21646/m.30319 type:complete len:106 (-) Transcript_21646:92-409(-)
MLTKTRPNDCGESSIRMVLGECRYWNSLKQLMVVINCTLQYDGEIVHYGVPEDRQDQMQNEHSLIVGDEEARNLSNGKFSPKCAIIGALFSFDLPFFTSLKWLEQ